MAVPFPDRSDLAEYGGATINVYTLEISEEAARELALQEIRDAGWEPQEIEDQFWLTRADLTDTPEGLEYFEQALVDGIVLVVHTYPDGPLSKGSVH
ncbi:hypothetical protein [Lysobacter humi (ex Lee et al. 2017)]